MKSSFSRLTRLGAAIALMGFIFSGPLSFALVQFTHPQPAWVSAAVFVQHYHVVQDVPFYFGFLLVAGMLMLVAGHYLGDSSGSEVNRFFGLLSLVFTIVFSVLIFFNYTCQVSFVRNLVTHYHPGYDYAIATFSMANPQSLCWSIEMWGYAFLGMATWLLSVYYKNKNRLIEVLLISNGVVSVLGAALTIASNDWLLTPTGLAAYMFWNLLMIVLLFLIYKKTNVEPFEYSIRK